MADAPASPGGASPESGDHSPRSTVREQDRFLPIANISRIMKKGLPANGKIAKDAKETVQECVSEFISFITSEASDKCQREKRKTINGDDLLWAMATLGFEDYIDPLKVYLARYREIEGDNKGSAKGGEGSARKDAVGGQSGPNALVVSERPFIITLFFSFIYALISLSLFPRFLDTCCFLNSQVTLRLSLFVSMCAGKLSLKICQWLCLIPSWVVFASEILKTFDMKEDTVSGRPGFRF